MSTDVTHLLAGQRGDEYVETLRGLALLVTARGGSMRCGACDEKAVWVGMQACGAPGGPICQACLQNQRDWINASEGITDARPFCRHCSQDVGRDHIYAVSLYDSTAAPEML